MASKSTREAKGTQLALLPSSFASSHNQQEPTSDVFLSFRGEDTRTTFTDHLYLALKDAGINVFRDTEGLWKGEDISRLYEVIRGCRISVVIFSKNYAESSWCLEELATIIECKQTSSQLVLPVFYDINPSYVRKQTGPFKKAFKRHNGWFLSRNSKVERWKAAATEAGSLSGWDLTAADDRHEGKTIKEIVRAIMCKLNETPLDLAKYPVGLESRLEKLSSMLEDGTDNDVRFVGIGGMGGIGKTTLAKALYNRLFDSFQSKCFLADVRENFNLHEGQVHLQEQLLSELLKSKEIRLGNIHRGINVMKARLSQMRVLIVLDDISQSEQLAVLARERDWFGPGSRIVITTRDLDLLKEVNVDCIYMARELDDVESLELFSHHAFSSRGPGKELKELVGEFLSYCRGLPLALQVLGSSLLDRSMEEWKSLSNKLKEVPHHQIQQQLKISYEALADDKERDLFLDIACFFVGFERDYVVKVLDGCGLYAEIGISILRMRCLLEIDEKNKLRMHDLIRDMGREIVREKSPRNPGIRSRLWFHEDALLTLQNHLGSEEVEGIALNSPKSRMQVVDAEGFARMNRLRLLQLDNVNVNGACKLLSKNLRWLHWHKYPLGFLPEDFPVEMLVVIDLQFSNLNALWKSDKFLGHLKVLNLSYSPLLTKTPDFSKLPILEELILTNCTKLAKVHSSVGYLQKLFKLNLRNCKNLEKIPSSICKAISLKFLDISGCSKIKSLPEEFGDMKSLEEFLAEGTSIMQVPSSIACLTNLTNASFNVCKEPMASSISSFIWSLVSPTVASRTKDVQMDFFFQLTSLRTLRLANCNLSDASFPVEGLGSLRLLENLDLRGNHFSGLPDTFKHLPKLEKLLLDDCTNLRSLPSMPESLFVLSMVNCLSLKENPHEHNRECMMLNVRCTRTVSEIGILQPARAIVHMEWCNNLSECWRLAKDSLENFILRGQGRNNCNLGNNFLRRSDIPDWFDYQAMGPSLTFQMSPSHTCRLKGVTICVIYTSNNDILAESPSPAHRVTVRNGNWALELIHQTGETGDNGDIFDAVIGEGTTSFAWLIHLPHQVIFRDELNIEGDVELEADSGSSSLNVERIGIHFGSQVCRYCHFDSSKGTDQITELAEQASSSSAVTALTSSCEFDMFQVMPRKG